MHWSRPDLLLRSPLCRRVLAGYVGYGPEQSFEEALFERFSLGPVPGTAPLTLGGATLPGRPQRRRWQDVTPAKAVAFAAARVAGTRWQECLAQISESELLGNLSGDTWAFGFSGGDEEIWG